MFGLLFGGLVGAGGYYAYQSQKPVENCADMCGEGTSCVEGRCQVVVAEVEEPADETKDEKRKRRRRKKKSGGGEGGTTAVARVDDSHVPRYDRTKAKMIGEGTGSERLSDRAIDKVLRSLDPKFQDCVAKAAMASDEELKSGRVSYEFGIAPSGKVTGVNVTAPSHLKALGVDACVRVAVYKAKFPSFDGIDMGAEGSFSI